MAGSSVGILKNIDRVTMLGIQNKNACIKYDMFTGKQWLGKCFLRFYFVSFYLN